MPEEHWIAFYKQVLIDDFIECFPEFNRDKLSVSNNNGTLQYNNGGYDFIIDFNLPSFNEWKRLVEYE